MLLAVAAEVFSVVWAQILGDPNMAAVTKKGGIQLFFARRPLGGKWGGTPSVK